MAQLRAKAHVKLFNSNETAYIGKTFWNETKLRGFGVICLDSLEVGIVKFQQPVQCNEVSEKSGILMAQLDNMAQKFTSQRKPAFVYFCGPANVKKLVAKTLHIDPKLLVHVADCYGNAEDMGIHAMCQSRHGMEDETKWSMELLVLMGHITNSQPQLIELDTLYATLIRLKPSISLRWEFMPWTGMLRFIIYPITNIHPSHGLNGNVSESNQCNSASDRQ